MQVISKNRMMKQKEIQIPRKITLQLLHLAQQSPEDEVCGLVGSVNGVATSCYPIQNIAEQTKNHYQLDSKQHIKAVSAMREKNEDFFAIYHSHPTSPAKPSATDIKLANYPETMYLIISLNTKGVLEMRGFYITDERVEEITLNLIEN